MRIIIDSREQNPYIFSGMDAATVTGALNAGDYSIPGFEDRVAVERKELGDIMGCLTHDRERFKRELIRLRGYESAVIVIEAKYEDIAAGHYRSNMQPKAAVQSLNSIICQYRMPIFFAGDRAAGEMFTFDFLRHYLRHAIRRYKAVADMQTAKRK